MFVGFSLVQQHEDFGPEGPCRAISSYSGGGRGRYSDLLFEHEPRHHAAAVLAKQGFTIPTSLRLVVQMHIRVQSSTRLGSAVGIDSPAQRNADRISLPERGTGENPFILAELLLAATNRQRRLRDMQQVPIIIPGEDSTVLPTGSSEGDQPRSWVGSSSWGSGSAAPGASSSAAPAGSGAAPKVKARPTIQLLREPPCSAIHMLWAYSFTNGSDLEDTLPVCP